MLLHSCTTACAHGPKGALTNERSMEPGARPYTVDFHAHVLTEAVEAVVAGRPEKLAEPGQQLRLQGGASVRHNREHMLPPALRRMTHLDERLADMATMGVDVQVLSPSPTQYYYWADRDLASHIVQLQNEHIAEACARHPKHLVGLGTVSLQHPDLAVTQLSEAVNVLGLKGVEICTSVNGCELSDPALLPFWSRVAELEAVVFLHPMGTSLGERVNRHYLSNTIGQPLETTVALSELIFSGVLDRYPGLKLVAAHGGGYLPACFGRSQHAHRVRPEAGGTARAPSEHLKSIWFDTLVYEPQLLRHLIDIVGSSQLVVGTDYPFDMGHYAPHALLAQVPGLGESERHAIVGGNAARLLGLSVSHHCHPIFSTP